MSTTGFERRIADAAPDLSRGQVKKIAITRPLRRTQQTDKRLLHRTQGARHPRRSHSSRRHPRRPRDPIS